MRHSIFCLTVLVILTLIGCSGGGSAIAPDLTGQGGLSAGSPMNNSQTWGVFDLSFDQASGSFSLSKSRQSTMHLGIDALLGEGPAVDFINLNYIGLDRTNQILSFDIAVINPFTKAEARDVRVAIIGDKPGYYLTNADGAFPAPAGDLPATFIAYARDSEYRIFQSGVTLNERFELHYPANADFRTLKLIIDGSFTGNRVGPYGFDKFSFGGNILDIGILDWQGDVDNAYLVTTPSSTIADVSLTWDPSSELWTGYFDETSDSMYRVLSAKFIGRLAENGLSGLAPAETDLQVESVGQTGEKRTSRIVYLKTESGGEVLMGLIRVDLEILPQDPVAELLSAVKMAPSVMDDFYNPVRQDETVNIVAYISGTPLGIYADIKNNADAAFPRIKEIDNEIKRRMREAQPEIAEFAKQYGDAFKAGDRGAISIYVGILNKHSAGKGSLGSMVREMESLHEARARDVTSQMKADIEPLQDNAVKAVTGMAETTLLSRNLFINGLHIQTTIKHLGEIAAIKSVEYIEYDYELAPQLDIAHMAINAPAMWGAGYTGGTYDVLVFDTGSDSLHPALMSHYGPGQEQAFGGPCSPDDTNGHGTHVAGIVASTDATYRGTGYGLDKLYNGMYCAGGWSSVDQALAWAGLGGSVPDPAETISFSWAWGPLAGCVRDGNTSTSRSVDESAYLTGQLWSIAAGNTPTTICGDDNMITTPSDAYNAFCVGNMNDMNTVTRADDSLAPSSRLGPGVAPGGELRVKPELCAPGSSIMSTAYNWETGPDFVPMTGTSMATPSVSGASALVMDAGVTTGLEVRALLTNTAEDWNALGAGPANDGPDNQTGYGYMNLATTLLNIGNVVSDTIATGDVKFYRQATHPSTHDSVMVLWDRYVSGLATQYADIDLEMWDDGTNTIIGAEDKTYDNKRFLYTGTTNDVVYKVEGKSIPSVSPTWDYVITANGGVLSGELLPGNLDPVLGYPSPMPVSVDFNITASITNTGDFMLRNLQATLTLDTDMTFVGGSLPTENGPLVLAPTQNTIITWQCRLNAPSLTPKHISVTTAATAYGEIFSGYAEADINVVPPDPSLYVHPTTLNFATATTVMPFSINNTGGGTLNWTIDDTIFPAWLSINNNGDSTQDETDTVQVIVDRSAQTPSTYTYDFDVLSDYGNDTVHVSMVVPDPVIPVLQINSLNLDFGTTLTQQNVIVKNSGGGSLNWFINHAPPWEYPSWLSTSVDAGVIDELHPQGGAIVYVNRAGLLPADYSYDMHFESDGGNLIVHVTMTVVTPAPLISVNHNTLDFGSDKVLLEFIISNIGASGSVLNWSIPILGNPPWLSLNSYSGAITTSQVSTVQVMVDRGTLSPADYQHLLQITSDGGNKDVQVLMNVPFFDPLTPIQIAPPDGLNYEVTSYLSFAWFGSPGYDGMFWMDAKRNGVPFAPFSNLAIPTNSLTLPPALVDKLARHGTWEWQVSAFDSPGPINKHSSEWWSITKEAPQLLTPPNNSVVNASTVFTWNKVASADDAMTVYVAKVTGFKPIDPLYYWWPDTGSATLPPNWFQILKDLGQSNTYTWTITAATRPSEGMTSLYAEKLKYPPAWTFKLQ